MPAMLLNVWIADSRGRGSALARHLEIPPSMVTKMASGKKQVPLDHCPLIQDFTGGQVTCEELRPDRVEYFALIRAQASAAAAPHPLRRASDRPHPLRRSTDAQPGVLPVGEG